MTSAVPAGRGWGVPVPAARIERTSAARKRPRPLQRSQEYVVAVGRGERVQLTQLGPEAGVTGCGGTGQERLRRLTQAAELFPRRGSGSNRPPRHGPGAAMVLVHNRGVAGGDGCPDPTGSTR